MSFYLMKFEMPSDDGHIVASVSLLRPSLVSHFRHAAQKNLNVPVSIDIGGGNMMERTIQEYLDSMSFVRISRDVYVRLKSYKIMHVGPFVLQEILTALVEQGIVDESGEDESEDREDTVPVTKMTEEDIKAAKLAALSASTK